MGTKIEYSINLLATSIDSNNFTAGGVDVWEHYQNKGLTNNHYSIGVNKKQGPMDRRVLEKNHIESIKKTMQMHEDIFKYQIRQREMLFAPTFFGFTPTKGFYNLFSDKLSKNFSPFGELIRWVQNSFPQADVRISVRELHRLYSVQKMLMDEHKKEIKQKNFWTPMNSIGISHPHFIQQQQQTTQVSSYGHDLHVQRLKDVYSNERSGSCSVETIKRQRGFDLERPAEVGDIFAEAQHGCGEGEAGPSSFTAFQNCKISTNGSDVDMEVDLTLSVGGSQVKKRKKSFFLPLGCSDSSNGKTRELNSSVSFQSDRVGDCSDPTTPMSSSSVTYDQERKGPHWLSQGLRFK